MSKGQVVFFHHKMLIFIECHTTDGKHFEMVTGGCVEIFREQNCTNSHRGLYKV